MAELHSLLRRQLKRVLGAGGAVPAEWRPLVDLVDAAYRQFDADRTMLERSLDLSSQELLQANAEMRGMFRAFPDILFRLAPDGTILDLRGSSPQDFYRAPEELIGRRIQNIPVAELGKRFEAALAEVRVSGAIVSLEYPLPRNGHDAHFEARLVPLPGGEVIVLVRDITQRQRSDLDRRESLALFRSLIENMNAGVLVERDRTVFAANTTFCGIFGIAGGPEGLVGADCAAAAELSKGLLAHPDAFPRRIEDIIRRREQVSGEEIAFADGRVFERDHIPIASPEGRFFGHMWQYRDVTERRSLDLQLRQAQKMEAVGRLAGGIAHDFNNLLTSILGYSELVVDSLADDRLRGYVVEVRRAGERAADLTRQLLAFSCKQVLQPRVLNLNEVVEGLRKMLERLIGENIRVVTRLDSELGSVRADAGQLEQMIVNLVVNSRDAMPEGGSLLLATENVTLAEAHLVERVLMAPGSYAMLAVTDTGCGIDQETQSRVFEPFFTTKEKGKGTGLGLSTVYGIVKQSGGYIWVFSEVGKGTTFKVYLPLVDAPAEPPAPRVDLQRRLGVGTVLVLEDEGALRALAHEVLEQGGYDVLEAASGEEGVRAAEAFGGRIDLLLSDVVLPELSGPDVAAILLRNRPGMKVLLMSGYTDTALPRRLGNGGPTAFLQKPFTPSALLAKVQDLLRR